MVPGWARLEAGAVTIAVRLTPKSSRDALEGPTTADDGREFLKARVRAAPENGKANRALEKILAKATGVAKTDVEVVAGRTSRLKSVRIACSDVEAVMARLIASG